MSWPVRRCHQKSGSRTELVTGTAQMSTAATRKMPPGVVSRDRRGRDDVPPAALPDKRDHAARALGVRRVVGEGAGEQALLEAGAEHLHGDEDDERRHGDRTS